MLTFKVFKLAAIFFVLAFVLFSHNVSLAQERINGRDSGMAVLVESAEIKTGDNGIEIEAVLFNPSSTAETPLSTYLLTLNSIDPLAVSKNLDYTPSPLIISAQEGEDYFSLKPKERKTVKYFLPTSRYLPTANYAFNFRLMRKDGDTVGLYREILRNFGFNEKKSNQENYNKGFLAFYQESCVILNAKGDKFEPNEGPVFNSSEQPKVRCLVKNVGDEDIAVRPQIEWKEFFVYGRPSSGARLEKILDDTLTFKKGETKSVEISLPPVKEPQVYQAMLSFEDESGAKRSFNMPFRWTIGGSSARVDKVSLISPIKNIYQNGETMSLSVDYFGSMDLYWNNSSGDLAGLGRVKMLAVVKDKNGEVCGDKVLNLPDINDSARKNQIIDIVLDKKCENASYAVSIHSGEEKLAEETAEVPKTAESKTMKNYYYYIIAAVLFLALFALIKRRKKAIVPAIMILFAFSAFGLFFNSADASATKNYTGIKYGGEDYGGDAFDNSDPLYSFYGVNDTSNVNKLVIKKIEANLDSDLNGFFADIYYAAGFTSCSNSTMQIRFKMYIEADGLSKTQVNFAPSGSVNYQPKQIREYTSITYKADEELFDIDPSFLKNFYDSSGNMRTNPRLIVEIVQSGKSTHSNPYHRGDFSKPVSTVDFASRSDAFDASDTIRYTIPLNLPDPSLSNFSLSGTSPIGYNCKPTLNWTVNDVKSCSANGGWSGTKSAANGTHSETMASGITSSTNYGLSCSRNLGSTIGTKAYTGNVTVGVNARPTADLKANGSNYDISVSPSSKVALTWARSSSWSSCNLDYYDGSNTTTLVSNAGVTGSKDVTMGSVVGSYKIFSLSCSNSCGYNGVDSQKATVSSNGSVCNNNGTQDNGEMGVDCGGGNCPTCKTGDGDGDPPPGDGDGDPPPGDGDGDPDGACGSTNNACDSGSLEDINDDATKYLWNCIGSTTANCSLPKGGVNDYTLTINITGGSGTVSKTESGVTTTLVQGSAGKSCSVSYTKGTVLDYLSASGDVGYGFGGWGGDCDVTGNNCKVTLDDNKTISASFNTNSSPYICTSNCGGDGDGDPPPVGGSSSSAPVGGSSSSAPVGGASSSSSSRPSVIIQEI